MELSYRTHKVSRFAPQHFDFISGMPDNVITDILDRLPVQDAVRTSILSRNWRFKWTIYMLTQLVFNTDFYNYLSKTKHKNDYERIISRLLLNLRGAITKFFLYIDDLSKCNNEDIAHWLLFLSRKGVKDLSICNMNEEPFELPTHLFSYLELIRLDLYCFCFDLLASFHGFPNLLSLELGDMEFESGKLGEFLTQCPALENLKLDHTNFQGQVKPVEIATLTNLKTLSLIIRNFGITVNTSSSFIFELVAFLPKLQELHLDFDDCEPFTEDGALRRFPATFLCLKTLKLSSIDLDNGIMFSFAFEMINSFPNLQTLKIKAGIEVYNEPPHAVCLSEADYNQMELLQLRRVVLKDFKGAKNEVGLIKCLLACSPFLKKIVIRPYSILKSKELMFTKKLLKLHRASPVAEIDVVEIDL